MAVTNLYCIFRFFSEDVKFDIQEFSSEFQINDSASWALGDLRDENIPDSVRLSSSVVIESKVSSDYDGEQVISDFFDYLMSKRSIILSLREKYGAQTFLEIVVNLESEDMPVILLQNNQLEFLAAIGSRLEYCMYDYR